MPRPFPPPTAGSTTLAASIAVLLAVTYAIVGLQGIGTIWDCASILYYAVDTGRPFVYSGRYTDAIFGWAAIAAHRVTDNLRVVEAAFAMAHLSVTLIAWVLTAYLLRGSTDIPRLIAALMILTIPLPGQAYVCTDINHVAVMVPVLILLAAQPMTGKRLALFAVVAAACFLDHPGSLFAFILVGIVLGAKWTLERRFAWPSDRYASVLTGLLLGASLLRFSLGLTEYEKSDMRFATTMLHLTLGLVGLPGILALLAYVAAGALLLVRFDAAAHRSALWTWIMLGALLAGAASILPWAVDPVRWIHGDTYRKFTLLLNLPIGAALAGVLFLDQRLPPAAAGWSGRASASAALCILVSTHIGCLLIQGTNYAQMRARLKDELSQSTGGVVLLPQDHWAFMTPLRVWALPFNSILLQGRMPTTVASFSPVEDTVVDASRQSIRFGTIPELDIASSGWFRFDQLLNIEREPRVLRSRAPCEAHPSSRPGRPC